jgi:ATP-binding cassette subfamily B protein RaxB
VRREAEVAAALRGLAMTRIVVAHRRETIATADRVLTLEGGRLVPAQHTPVARDEVAGTPGMRAVLGTVTREQQELLGNLGC